MHFLCEKINAEKSVFWIVDVTFIGARIVLEISIKDKSFHTFYYINFALVFLEIDGY